MNFYGDRKSDLLKNDEREKIYKIKSSRMRGMTNETNSKRAIKLLHLITTSFLVPNWKHMLRFVEGFSRCSLIGT